MSDSLNNPTPEQSDDAKKEEIAKKPKRGGFLSQGVTATPAAPTSFVNMAAPSPKKVVTPEMKKSSITVTGSTRIMLNALVMLDKAETIDDLVSNVVGDYVNSELTDAEKQQYDMLVERLRAKINK